MTGPVPTTYQRIWRLSADRTHLFARGVPDIPYQPVTPDPAAGILTRIRGRAVYTNPVPPPDRTSLVPGVDKPDTTNTGVFSGTTFTNQNSAITYSTNGQTLTAINYTEIVSISGQNVTFNNCYFRGSPTTVGACAVFTNTNVVNLRFIDCTFEQQNPVWDSPAAKGHHVTFLRCNFVGVTDGFQHIGVGGASYDTVDQNIVVQQCLFDNLCFRSPDPGAAGGLPDNQSHLDCCQFRGGRNFLVWGNTMNSFYNPAVSNGGLPINLASGTHVTGNRYATALDASLQGTSCGMMSPQLGRMGNFQWKDNWMDGGSYMINYPHTAVDTGGINPPAPFKGGIGAEFTGNRVGYNSRGGNNHFIICPAALPVTITGNVRPDTGAPANFRANG